MKKSIGELIDALSVTNIKIYMLVERVERKENTVEEGQRMNALVKYRSQLTNAINAELGVDEQIVKVYGSDKK